MSKDFEYEYNPIKEAKDGEQAQAVVWSTRAINIALEGMNKGLPLKANPFIGKNTKLLKPDLVIKKTKEEIEDYIKCMEDPVYFASKCYIMQPTGLEPCILRDYQIEYLHHLQNHRFSMLLACRQAGKSVTTAIYCLWVILFNTDKNGLILSKSGPAGVDLLSKIKDMYLYLPYHLKIGTMKWNQSSISFDNNSSISTEAFSPTAGLGKTINFLILDEFAWCPPNDVELFYNNIIPTVTTISDSNVCIMSTQNGFNLFYTLWDAAIKGKNIYAPFKVDWYQVPQYNNEKHIWEKRTNAWKEMMVGILGSEEAFYYQYGTQFSASDKCLVSRETLKRIRDRHEKFTNEQSLNANWISAYKELLYIKPNYDINNFKSKWYIILVDLAEGGGGDADSTIFNILEIVSPDKFEQVAYWKCNNLDLEKASLEFWLMYNQLFNPYQSIVSIEWNTYGALFYNYIINYNEYTFLPEYSYRFNITNGTIEFDTSVLVTYKKGNIDEEIAGLKGSANRIKIPGFRFNSNNKKTACALLKMQLETDQLIISADEQISELENFEDKNGNGSYEASWGHDDMVMTLCQLPMVLQSQRYKNLMEEYNAYIQVEKFNKSKEQSLYNAVNNNYFENELNKINNYINNMKIY